MLAIPAFMFVVSVIVVIHELGHYWMARLFGTRIDAFSVGFGPKLFGWVDKLGTQWKVCLLPLGGYVKFHGDATAASVPDREKLEELKKQVAAEGVDPNTILHFKPLYQRALIVFAGPLANFILAIVLLTGVYSIAGEPTYDVVIAKVLPDTPAERAGLKPGDQIVAINGWKVYSFSDVTSQVTSSPGKVLTFTIERGSDTFNLAIRLQPKQLSYPDGKRERTMRGGRLGIERADVKTYKIVHHDPATAAMRGIQLITLQLRSTYWYLGDVFSGQTAPDQLGGPLRIAKYSGEFAAAGVSSLVLFIAVISVSVGLINLFPIPVLDGGHLLFYAIEAIQGRPLSNRVQEIGFRIGLALILALFVFVTWNDILFLLPGSPVGQGSP